MGYDASWTPIAGGLPVVGRVLLKEPTEKDLENRVEYNPFIYLLEYFKGTFDGLLESSRGGAIEKLIVLGNTYEVRLPIAKYDGKTIVLICEKIT